MLPVQRYILSCTGSGAALEGHPAILVVHTDNCYTWVTEDVTWYCCVRVHSFLQPPVGGARDFDCTAVLTVGATAVHCCCILVERLSLGQ